jgi:hypothetical protein
MMANLNSKLEGGLKVDSIRGIKTGTDFWSLRSLHDGRFDHETRSRAARGHGSDLSVFPAAIILVPPAPGPYLGYSDEAGGAIKFEPGQSSRVEAGRTTQLSDRLGLLKIGIKCGWSTSRAPRTPLDTIDLTSVAAVADES